MLLNKYVLIVLSHLLWVEVANLFGGIDGNVDRLIMTNGLSGHKLA